MNTTRIALIAMLMLSSLAFVPSASAEIYWCGTGPGSDRPTNCCRWSQGACEEAGEVVDDAVDIGDAVYGRASATAFCYVNEWEPFPIGSGINGAWNCAFNPN